MVTPSNQLQENHTRDDLVQDEMNKVAQRYLKAMAMIFTIFYVIRGTTYLTGYEAPVSHLLGWPSLATAIVGGAIYAMTRRRQYAGRFIEGSFLLLGALLLINLYWTFYHDPNPRLPINTAFILFAAGLGTTRLVNWILQVTAMAGAYLYALYGAGVVDQAFGPMFVVSALLLSYLAFVARVSVIKERVALDLEVREKAEKLEAANKAKDRFLANMTHELRTPMTGVIGMMDLLRGTRLTDEQDRLLKSAKTSAGYLLAIINDILDFSKLESGKFELSPGPMDAVSMTRDVAGMLRGQAEAKGLSVTVHASTAPEVWVSGDSVRLGQVLFNLIGNAIKFTDKGAVDIFLDSEEEQEGLRLKWRVKDTGVGIPKEQIPRLFDRFEQVDGSATRKEQTGTGLGLAIIRELVSLMKGDILVESREGVGSEFQVSVPLPRSKKVLAETNAAAPAVSYGLGVRLNILVAEDNMINQVIVRKLLEKEGCSVTIVENGEAAVEAATAPDAHFDIILMDVRMPIMDGPTATKIIKEKLADPPPVVALTANTLKEDVEDYLAAGMDAHVGKPIVIEELMEAVRRLVRTDAA